ncbi:hypothetical protein EVAR_34513_1 [Eumeta japonica]|uniref:Uncharacterized protein n=1 Tax=Eumeta variegata TaxID=151549 RepID=A0A4C1Z7H5_EUMVA|nr:hypothetical protein EVAR_34513_1 [Eumeta japonica]
MNTYGPPPQPALFSCARSCLHACTHAFLRRAETGVVRESILHREREKTNAVECTRVKPFISLYTVTGCTAARGAHGSQFPAGANSAGSRSGDVTDGDVTSPPRPRPAAALRLVGHIQWPTARRNDGSRVMAL